MSANPQPLLTDEQYLLVSQIEPRVEMYRRQASGEWLLSESTGLDATCCFDSLECTIPFAEIYGKVKLDTPETPA